MILNKSTVFSPIGEDGIFPPNSEPYTLTYEENEQTNGGNGAYSIVLSWRDTLHIV